MEIIWEHAKNNIYFRYLQYDNLLLIFTFVFKSLASKQTHVKESKLHNKHL